jgi:hypothetical protein
MEATEEKKDIPIKLSFDELLNTLNDIEKDYHSSHIFTISALFIDLFTNMGKDDNNKCLLSNINILEIEYFKINYIIFSLYKESKKENKKINSLIDSLLDNIST